MHMSILRRNALWLAHATLRAFLCRQLSHTSASAVPPPQCSACMCVVGAYSWKAIYIAKTSTLALVHHSSRGESSIFRTTHQAHEWAPLLACERGLASLPRGQQTAARSRGARSRARHTAWQQQCRRAQRIPLRSEPLKRCFDDGA